MKDQETPLRRSPRAVDFPGLSSEGTNKRRVMHRSQLLAGLILFRHFMKNVYSPISLISPRNNLLSGSQWLSPRIWFSPNRDTGLPIKSLPCFSQTTILHFGIIPLIDFRSIASDLTRDLLPGFMISKS